MKKEALLHFGSLLVLLIFVFVWKRWFLNLELRYLLYVLGGIIGTILPDLDHLLYVYLMRPEELTSQRVRLLSSKRSIGKTLGLLYITREERKRLVFHTALMQVVFFVFAFLVVTSSGSLLGRGIVIAFLVHLLVDQFIDLRKTGTISNWFHNLPINLDKSQEIFWWLANLFLVLLIA